MDLSPPQPDQQTGKVAPHDHPGILNEHELIRGVPELHYVPDGKGGRKLSSALFEADAANDEGISFNLKTHLEADQIDPVNFTHQRGNFVAVAIVPVNTVRAANMQVGYDPEPDNAYHAQAWGLAPKGKRRQIASASNVILK
jgi:hypothetical protein